MRISALSHRSVDDVTFPHLDREVVIRTTPPTCSDEAGSKGGLASVLIDLGQTKHLSGMAFMVRWTWHEVSAAGSPRTLQPRPLPRPVPSS